MINTKHNEQKTKNYNKKQNSEKHLNNNKVIAVYKVQK